MRIRGIVGVAGVLATLALATVGTACKDGEAADKPTESASPAGVGQQMPVSPSTGAPQPTGASAGVERTAGAAYPSYAGVATYQVAGGQVGVWVTGQARITVKPDLALLSIGVETTAVTLADARGQAAAAMDAIVGALRQRGVAEADVQTTSFNVWPEYEYQEVYENGRRVGKQLLTGYRVSNTAVIKVRTLDTVGQIIDDVAAAGGDATRVNGISFTIEDPSPFMVQLREAAVGDAVAKARQLATLAGAGLGKLVYIAESGGAGPLIQDTGTRTLAMAEAGSMATTPISGGELELQLSVQAAFGIE